MCCLCSPYLVLYDQMKNNKLDTKSRKVVPAAQVLTSCLLYVWKKKFLCTFFTAYSASSCCVETYSALICDVKIFSQVTHFKTGHPDHKKLWDDELRAIIPEFEGMKVSGSI